MPPSSKQIVKVNEVLKGNLNAGDEISIYCNFFELEYEGGVAVQYTHTYDPMLETETEYLFCLDYEDGWGTEEIPYGIYVVEAGVYGSAINCDGMLYPRFNTEYHPFFERTLDELKAKER